MTTQKDSSGYDYWYWHYIRRELLARDKRCFYCNKDLDKYTVTIDHVIPRVKGGSDEMNNLVAACKECNQEKKDMLPHEFMMSRTVACDHNQV